MAPVFVSLSNVRHLAIIAPAPEVSWLSDAVASREGPVHVASLIALVALIIIAWVLLSDAPPRNVHAAKGRPEP